MSQEAQNSAQKSQQPQQQQQQNLIPRKTIGDFQYNLTDKIGEGFSSIVYKGIDTKSKEIVAVKVVELKKITNDVQKYLLQTELRILQKLKHPNILNMRQLYQTSNNTYIITEFCNQGDLSTLLEKYSRLQENTAVQFLRDIVLGLKECEQKNVIHRDLKPANIFLKDGVAKIADFGFSQDLDIPPFNQFYNVGSPNYMCPQSLIHNKYSFKSDIWSLGALFFELLYGVVPWQAPNEKELAVLLQNKPVQFPNTVNVSEQCKDFIRQCLIKDESKRWNISQLLNHPIIKVQIPKQIQQQTPTIEQQNKQQIEQHSKIQSNQNKQQEEQNNKVKSDQQKNVQENEQNQSKNQIKTTQEQQQQQQEFNNNQQQQQKQENQQFLQRNSTSNNKQNVKQQQNQNQPSQQQKLIEQNNQQQQQESYIQKEQNKINTEQNQLLYGSHSKTMTQPDVQVQDFLDSKIKMNRPRNMVQIQGENELRANRAITKDSNHVLNESNSEQIIKTTPNKIQTEINESANKNNAKKYQTDNQKNTTINETIEQHYKIIGTYVSPRPHTINLNNQAFEALDQLSNNDKIILSQVNFCRFLQRTFKLFEEHSISQTPYLNERIKFLFLKNLMIKISSLKQFVDSPNAENSLNFTDFNSYINSSSFKNFKQVINEYYQKYNQQFTFYWESTYNLPQIKQELIQDQKFEAIFDNNFSEFSSFYIIQQSYLKQVIRDINHLVRMKTRQSKVEDTLPAELQATVLLLDFLVILYQLIQILLNNFQDFQAFSSQSNINNLVETQQNQNIRIVKEQYMKIRNSIYSLDI